MGRRDKERKERLESGQEQPFAQQRDAARRALRNPISRKVLSRLVHKDVVKELSEGTTDDQIERLDAVVESSKLKKALMDKAPGEMDKAIKLFRKQGKEIGVGSLCAEIKNTPSFLKMCANVGLEVSWFEELAKKRMEANGI